MTLWIDTRNSAVKTSGVVLGCMALTFLLLAALGGIMQAIYGETPKGVLFIVVFVPIILGVGALLLLELFILFFLCCFVPLGLLSSCPSCHRLYGRKRLRQDFVGQKQGQATVDRTDKHFMKDGRLVGKTQRQEQVAVNRKFYRNSWNCRFCNHDWEDMSVEQHETY